MDEHPDRDASATLARHLAVAVQVAEAAIRLRQHALDRSSIASEHTTAAVRAEQRTRHAADRLTYTPALNSRWVQTASLANLGTAWGAAAGWADADPTAAVATTRIESRLADLAPAAMAEYDRLRAAGADRLDALRAVLPHMNKDTTERGGPTSRTAEHVRRDAHPAPTRRTTASGHPHPADVAAASHPRPYTTVLPALPATASPTPAAARAARQTLTR